MSTNTPAPPAPLSTTTTATAPFVEVPEAERKVHPLVAVGAGLIAGLLLARWIRK